MPRMIPPLAATARQPMSEDVLHSRLGREHSRGEAVRLHIPRGPEEGEWPYPGDRVTAPAE